MTAPSYDPTTSAPAPPATSDWPQTAPGPPSPFPWSTAGPSTPPRTPLVEPGAHLSPPRASVAQPIGASQPMARGASADSGYAQSLSPASAQDGFSSKVAAEGVSPRLGLGHRRASVPLHKVGPVRTPSGFEFLDYGDGAPASERQTRSFEWQAHAPSPEIGESTNKSEVTYKRRLGPTEVSYYLGSRGEGVENGVNDMYLHIGFKAKSSLVRPDRLLHIWTEIVNQHALLASTVEYDNVNEIRFCYAPPYTQAQASAQAKALMEVRAGQDRNALLDGYLNGERTLSDERLSYLVISTPEAEFNSSDSEHEQEYDFWLFSTHFLGDGMALHTTANEFFNLLAAPSPDAAAPNKNIDAVLAARGEDLTKPEAELEVKPDHFAHAMESKLVTPEGWGRMAWAGARVEFNRDQAKLIGGHAFQRAKLGERKTIVPTVSWDGAKTKKILANCKAHGATIATAVFALSNMAYIRSTPEGTGKGERDERLPVMLYSALNVRPFLLNEGDWYHIAIGYYNIILPAFMPKTVSAAQTFWHRSLVVRQQTSAVVKSKWMAPRAKLMALERERRSIGFEREDEAKRQAKKAEAVATGLGQAITGLGISQAKLDDKVATLPPPAPAPASIPAPQPAAPKEAPSTALMGLSMLGNLDGMYSHKTMHGLQLHTLTTGSRQRPGALLLFAYTFAGKFWMSLGYDSKGFKEGVIEKWWDEMLKGVDEFLLEE